MFFGNRKLEQELEEKNALIESLRNELRVTKARCQEELKNQRRELMSLNDSLETLKHDHVEYVHKVEESVGVDIESGAHNKRYFYDTVESLISLSRRNKTPLSLAVVEIKGFEKIGNKKEKTNDIIQIIVQRLSSKIRESDIFVRLDTMKFVLVLPQTSLSQAKIVCKQIQANISKYPIIDDLYFDISSGVAEFSENKNENVNSVLKRAEEMLGVS
jgi:diguanylate cyclase (GGDEF)-like protein